jgi:hypothetical protein
MTPLAQSKRIKDFSLQVIESNVLQDGLSRPRNEHKADGIGSTLLVDLDASKNLDGQSRLHVNWKGKASQYRLRAISQTGLGHPARLTER